MLLGGRKGREGASRIIRAEILCVWVSGFRRETCDIRAFFSLFTAGNCWLQQGKNGRCQVLYMPGMSREECCRSGRLGTSWTEEDVPNSTLFRWMIFNGGAPNCIPCKGGGALIFPLFSHNAQLFRCISLGGDPSLKCSTVARQSILTRGDEKAPSHDIT